MKDTSVIIVSWNAREYLRECIASVINTAGDITKEIIVVDNSSSDGSPDMVAREFPRVILICSPSNLGFSVANNLGMQRASGEILAFVNSDVVLHPNCLRTLTDHLRAHAEVGIAGPRIVGRDGRLQGSCRRLPSVWNNLCRALAIDRVLSASTLFSGHEMRHFAHDIKAEAEVLSGCLWVARRRAVDLVGPLDERFFFYMEDVDWCRRFRRLGWKLVFLPEATAMHYGAGSTSNAPLHYSLQYHRASLTYWRKYNGAIGEQTYRTIALTHHALRFCVRSLKRVISHRPSDESRHKLREDMVCLRWLMTGRSL